MTATDGRWARNRSAHDTVGSFPQPPPHPLAFHRRLPGYAPTPLRSVPALARRAGLAQVWVKDESSRLGLPSFKILGASWASYRALVARLGLDPAWSGIGELRAAVSGHRPLVLAAATDGNHGRAVARFAALVGIDARIFVPAGTAAARIDAIESEGAACVVVDGSYDDAVARCAQEAGDRCLVISDTSWPGYEQIPRWVIDGYSTIFWEIDDALTAASGSPPDVVVVPIGVGALAAAAVEHYRRRGLVRPPVLVGVEPEDAACMLASVRAGHRTTVPGPHRSIMVGLNCGTPSLVAWPVVAAGMDLFVAIADQRVRLAMRAFADAGIAAGETGAAALAGLDEIAAGELRGILGLGPSSSALVICTEGPTDPAAYRAIVGG